MDAENILPSELETVPATEAPSESTIPPAESSTPEDTLPPETVPVTEPVYVPIETSGVAETQEEVTATTVAPDDLVAEQLQQQTIYQGYICGFLLFLTIVVLLTHVYKFFRLFF